MSDVLHGLRSEQVTLILQYVIQNAFSFRLASSYAVLGDAVLAWMSLHSSLEDRSHSFYEIQKVALHELFGIVH